MWQAIGGFAVGLGAVLLGPRIISGVSSVASSVAEEAIEMSQSACVAIGSTLAAANEQVIGLVATITGESKEEAEREFEKAEGFVEEVVKDVAEDEAMHFIETLIVAAV